MASNGSQARRTAPRERFSKALPVAKADSIELDGLWYAIYGSSLGGNGCVLLRQGKVLGCDNQYFIEGSYQLSSEGTVTVSVVIEHFSGEARTIFGDCEPLTLTKYTVELSGRACTSFVVLTGHVEKHPDLVISVRLIRLLPQK